MRSISAPCFGLALVASAYAFQATVFKYQDKKRNVMVSGAGGRYSQSSNGKATIDVIAGPQGGVLATSKSQGISLSAKKSARVITVPNALKKGQSDIQDVLAKGGVVLTRKILSLTQYQITEVTGEELHFVNGPAEGTITLSGPVQIVNRDIALKRTLTATGDSGAAVLDTNATGKKNALQHAHLHGHVQIVVVQQKTKAETADTSYTAKGDELIADYTVLPNTLTLVGHVTGFGSTESGHGDVEGATKAVILLNDKGEMTDIELTSGDTGPIDTHFHPAKKAGTR